MQKANTLPLPESPPPLNIQSYMRLARTSVCHSPLVIAYIISNTFKTKIVIIVQITKIVLSKNGIIIDQKILKDLMAECPPVIGSLVKQLAYRLAQCDQEIQSLKKKTN